jgi:hypothetical protein
MLCLYLRREEFVGEGAHESTSRIHQGKKLRYMLEGREGLLMLGIREILRRYTKEIGAPKGFNLIGRRFFQFEHYFDDEDRQSVRFRSRWLEE